MAERTAKEWGRIAVGLPDWRWMPGMRYTYGGFSASTGASEDYVDRLWEDDAGPYDHAIFPTPDPDDPATAGCLMELLNWPNMLHNSHAVFAVLVASPFHPNADSDGYVRGRGPTLGRACIAAAEALGRWPGGAS